MAAIPRCSECPNRLVYPEGHPKEGERKPAGTKTCGQPCRQKRARRLRATETRRGQMSKHSPAVQTIAAVARGEMEDVAHEVMREELRPLVREAMTEEVLSSIDLLIKLTPTAIQRLETDLDSQHEDIRQRAYTLLLRYTMGNPSVAPPPSQQAPAPMSVVFNIPRPGDLPTDTTAQEVDDAEELRQCTDCSKHKPSAEFVGASNRCLECFDGLHDTLRERFAVTDDTAP